MRGDWLELKASAFVASCNGSAFNEIDNILFEWTVFERRGAELQHLSFVSTAKDPAIFRLPSFALESNTNYKVSVLCRRHGHLYNSTTSVNIRVKRGKVYAQINLGNDFSIRNGSIGLIDASYSYDEDQDPALDPVNSHQLQYYWSCKNKNPIPNTDKGCTDGLQLPLSFQNKDVSLKTFQFTGLLVGSYEFDLVVYDPTTIRVDSTSVVVEVMPPDFPSLHIPISTLHNLDLSTRLRLEASGLISQYATYSWKSEPSLKDGALDSPRAYGVSQSFDKYSYSFEIRYQCLISAYNVYVYSNSCLQPRN